MAQEIYHELAFNWWLRAVLKKRLRIISIVKRRNSRYLNKTHKFREEVPESVAQAYALDEKNGNTPLGRCYCLGYEGCESYLQKII